MPLASDLPVDVDVRPGCPAPSGTAGCRAAPAAPTVVRTPSTTIRTTSFRIALLCSSAVILWCSLRKANVKQRAADFSPAALVAGRVPRAARSVGQLAPTPDLTRQCAFDLRSRLAILALCPDDVRSTHPSFLRGIRHPPRLSCWMIEPAPRRRNRPFGLVPSPELGHLEPGSNLVRTRFVSFEARSGLEPEPANQALSCPRTWFEPRSNQVREFINEQAASRPGPAICQQ